MSTNGTGLVQWLLERAREAGASAAEVLMISSESISAGVRLGEVEKLKCSRERRLGLRVFAGQSSSSASTAEMEPAALQRFVTGTLEMARVTAADPSSGLPDPGLHPGSLPELELADRVTGVIGAERALDLARTAERAALAFDPRIRNSEGAEFDSGYREVLFANSQGFTGEYAGTSYGLSVVPVAQDGSSMQRDFWYSASRRFAGLEEAESIGRTAAVRSLRRLGARKVKTVRAPVVFDPDTAAGLISSLASAASGPSLYRGASFLLDKLGQQVASTNVTIIDDGTIPGALGSRPFDGEGLLTRHKALVDRGILATYLLDSYSARKLGLKPTGNASRAVGGPPGVSHANLYLKPGPYSPEQIISSIRQGLLVTELIGFGVNSVTGDYSRGASGIWIENGELAYPVEEITIAGNLKDMYQSIEMIGNDLRWRSSVVAPTVKVAELTIGGN